LLDEKRPLDLLLPSKKIMLWKKVRVGGLPWQQL